MKFDRSLFAGGALTELALEFQEYVTRANVASSRRTIVRTFHLMCVRCILTCSRMGITKQRCGTTLRAEGAAHRGPVRESNQICPSGFALVRAVRLAWLASAVRRAFRELWGLLL